MTTIKNSTVTREQYDKLQVDVVNRIEELEAKDNQLAQKVAILASREAEVQALRRESGKRRDWVAGLAVFSAVQAVTIWAMILEFIVF